MFITVTVKAEAQSRLELIDEFAGKFQALKQHFEQLQKEGVFGPPELNELRFLVIGGGFKPEQQQEQVSGTPDVE